MRLGKYRLWRWRGGRRYQGFDRRVSGSWDKRRRGGRRWCFGCGRGRGGGQVGWKGWASECMRGDHVPLFGKFILGGRRHGINGRLSDPNSCRFVVVVLVVVTTTSCCCCCRNGNGCSWWRLLLLLLLLLWKHFGCDRAIQSHSIW